MNFLYRTVGVASFLQCSRCDAHIGLLTQDDGTGEIQYYANGLAMTFSPKDKPIQKEMPNELSRKIASQRKGHSVQPNLTMDQIALNQLVGTGNNLMIKPTI